MSVRVETWPIPPIGTGRPDYSSNNQLFLQTVFGRGANITPGNPLPVTPVAGSGIKTDLQQVLGQGADIAPGNELLTNMSDRWARQLGQVDLARVLGAPLTAANPVISGVFDAAGNRMPAMDAIARAGFVDVIDRAVRLLGVVYGSQAQQIQQRAVTFETLVQLNQAGAEVAAGNPLPTEDTGVNTNPERWLHDNHWDSGVELVLNAAAAVNLGAAVAAGNTRRVRSITVRNTALVNTVITLSQAVPAQNRISFDVPAQGTRVWSEQDAVEFLAGVQSQIASSAAAVGAETYIHAAGVEAP